MKGLLLIIALGAIASIAQGADGFVQAELQTSLKTKTAKVGDPVKARTTTSATLANGTMLSRGTEIYGQVRGVNSNSISISFDGIEEDGKRTPMNLSIRAAMAPGAMAQGAAHSGMVVGMRGVTLDVDAGPEHSAKFTSTGKNLQLKQGLQVMVALPQ
jgi:hypothetical protein